MRKAIRLAKDGAIGCADKALQSTGVQSDIEAIEETLRDKHPQVEPPLEGHCDFEPHISLPIEHAKIEITEEEFIRAARKLPKGSAEARQASHQRIYASSSTLAQ